MKYYLIVRLFILTALLCRMVSYVYHNSEEVEYE